MCSGLAGDFFRRIHELLADTAALQAWFHHQHAKPAFTAREFEMRATDDLGTFGAQQDRGSRLRDQVLDVCLVGSRAVEKIGLGGPALFARFAAIGGIHERGDRLGFDARRLAKTESGRIGRPHSLPSSNGRGSLASPWACASRPA